jgi:hypothetical protein
MSVFTNAGQAKISFFNDVDDVSGDGEADDDDDGATRKGRKNKMQNGGNSLIHPFTHSLIHPIPLSPQSLFKLSLAWLVIHFK